MPVAPPDRIELPTAVLRRQRVDDAEAVAAAVGSNLGHLAPWMPWADEASADPAFQRRRLDEADASWEAGSDFVYLVLDAEETCVLGMVGLHARIGPGALEIGYWLRADATGRGLMTAAVGELTRTALALPGVERVEVHCDEANARSRAVPERLGYRLDRVEDRPVQAPGECGRHQVWVAPGPPP